MSNTDALLLGTQVLIKICWNFAPFFLFGMIGAATIYVVDRLNSKH